MPKATKRKESSEGEDFGNNDFSDEPSEDSESEIILPEDTWKPIVVDGTKRDDFVKVNNSLLKLMDFFFVLGL